MGPYFKKIINYLCEKVNITIIPSADSKVVNLSIRRIVPIVIIFAIIISITTLSLLYSYYQQNYIGVSKKLEVLRGVQAENQKLKTELYALAQDTERLKENLNQLQEYNNEIKGMIDIDKKEDQAVNEDDVDLKLHTYLTENSQFLQSGLPIGGGVSQREYRPSKDIIKQAKSNINILKESIPGQEEKLNKLELSVKEYNSLRAATPTIWPLADKGDAYISSEYGWRKDPFTRKQSLHEGLDIGVWYNTPVLATADGTVKFAGRNGGYGVMVIIEHGFGFETRYAHLNKTLVKKGQKVKRGDRIALSGNSGRSSGPHLHYEVLINNIPQNPRGYIGG